MTRAPLTQATLTTETSDYGFRVSLSGWLAGIGWVEYGGYGKTVPEALRMLADIVERNQ